MPSLNLSVQAMPMDPEDEMVLGLTAHAACLRERLHSGNTRKVIDDMVEEIRKRGGIDGDGAG